MIFSAACAHIYSVIVWFLIERSQGTILLHFLYLQSKTNRNVKFLSFYTCYLTCYVAFDGSNNSWHHISSSRKKIVFFACVFMVGVCIKLMLSTSFGTWSRQKVSKGQSTCFVVFLVQLLQHIFHPVSMSGSILHQVCLPSFSLSFVFLVICLQSSNTLLSFAINICLLLSLLVFAFVCIKERRYVCLILSPWLRLSNFVFCLSYLYLSL